jgi:hypothetical protein
MIANNNNNNNNNQGPKGMGEVAPLYGVDSTLVLTMSLFLRDIVCLRNICVNTLHKGDSDDNNNNKQLIQTDRTIPNNKPDSVIHDYEKGTCMLIDVAIPGDMNVIQKEAEKISKCKGFTTEIQRMWNVKTRVIPVIIGATGTVSKSFRKYVSTVPANHKVKEVQKTAILGCTHTSESADVEVH